MQGCGKIAREMQRLVPSDHEAGLQDIADKSLRRSPEHIRTSRYLDVKDNIAGELNHDGISSGGSTEAEALAAARDPLGFLERETSRAAVDETLKAAAVGAAVGTTFGAAATSLRVLVKARDGDVDVSESSVEITAGAVKAGVRSGATSGLAKVVEIGARNSTLFSPIAESTAPIAIANSVLEIGTAAYQFATGAIDRDELIDSCATATIRNTGAWAYGVAGQTLLPIPVVGALVGGRLADRFGRRRVITGGQLLVGAAVVALAALGTGELPLGGWLALLVFYLGVGLFTAAVFALFMDLTEPRLGATQFSAYMGLTNACEAWSSRAVGALVTGSGYPVAFLAAAGLGLVPLLLLPLLKPKAVEG